MLVLYFVYGLVFVSAGVLLTFQARLPPGVLSRRALGFLSAFALTHGLFEWGRMLNYAPLPGLAPSVLLEYLLLAGSFTLLMQFAIEVLHELARVPRWARFVPVAAFGLAIVLGLRPTVDVEMRSAEALVRYGLGLPAPALGALALFALGRARRRSDPEQERVARSLAFAAVVLAAYGILSGVLVGRADFFPASWLNAESFHQVTGVRVEVLRAASGVLIAALLSEAFVIESAREHADWERRREEFISLVAHELRSPIGAVSLGADTLRELLDRQGQLDPDKARKVLVHVKSSAGNLQRIVSDLLDTSRIEARTLVLRPQRVELVALVQGIVDRAAPATVGHRVELVLPEALPAVVADPARVEQVLTNLVSNAAKYSAPDGEIRIEVRDRQSCIEVAVTNVGEELLPEEQEQLFTRFYRTKANRDRVEGLGLGLYIAKGLVEAHGGCLTVQSERGGRTTFSFTLPHDAPT